MRSLTGPVVRLGAGNEHLPPPRPSLAGTVATLVAAGVLATTALAQACRWRIRPYWCDRPRWSRGRCRRAGRLPRWRHDPRARHDLPTRDRCGRPRNLVSHLHRPRPGLAHHRERHPTELTSPPVAPTEPGSRSSATPASPSTRANQRRGRGRDPGRSRAAIDGPDGGVAVRPMLCDVRTIRWPARDSGDGRESAAEP